ncbi:MAG: response regulator transcription factor, partial [Anaerolineaceae bacterium]|nr:response regulator transcription factor [Anaerolineaceae bacterium]
SYVGAGLHHYLLGRFAVEQNDLNTAEALLVESLERIRFLAEPYVKMRAWCWLAKIHFLQGKMAEVQNDLAQSRRCLPGRDLYAINFETRFDLMRAAPDGLEKAVQWARSVQLEPQNFRRMRSMILEGEWFFLSQMTLARVMIAQRTADPKFDLAPLFTALQNQQQVAEECTWHERVMEIMILRAMACAVTGQKEAAREALLQALALTANEPYVRLYVDEGEPMRQLLQDCRSRAERSLLPTIDALLNQFHAEKESPAAKAHDPQAGLIERLTERELEVLGLIAAGLSNAEIAARIYLSPNTLKAHTQSIYAKLDAHSRVQAVNRARELGLISSASN